MNIEVNEKFPIPIEGEGTVMDFVDGEFVFVLKDEEWTPFEQNALKHNKLSIDFVYKYDIAIFLLTLEDAIDTSDFIFNVHDNEYDDTLYRSFEKGRGFPCVLYLVDKDMVVKGKRKVMLNTVVSDKIVEKLIEQRDHPYMEEEFLCNLEGLQSAYEPFEMQALALASESFK